MSCSELSPMRKRYLIFQLSQILAPNSFIVLFPSSPSPTWTLSPKSPHIDYIKSSRVFLVYMCWRSSPYAVFLSSSGLVISTIRLPIQERKWKFWDFTFVPIPFRKKTPKIQPKKTKPKITSPNKTHSEKYETQGVRSHILCSLFRQVSIYFLSFLFGANFFIMMSIVTCNIESSTRKKITPLFRQSSRHKEFWKKHNLVLVQFSALSISLLNSRPINICNWSKFQCFRNYLI